MLGQAVVEDDVWLEFDGGGFAHHPLQELVALEAGDEARLGEVVGGRRAHSILSLLARLCRAQSSWTLSDTIDVPPREYGRT